VKQVVDEKHVVLHKVDVPFLCCDSVEGRQMLRQHRVLDHLVGILLLKVDERIKDREVDVSSFPEVLRSTIFAQVTSFDLDVDKSELFRLELPFHEQFVCVRAQEFCHLKSVKLPQLIGYWFPFLVSLSDQLVALNHGDNGFCVASVYPLS